MLQGSIIELRRSGARRIAILCYEPSDRWNVPDSTIRQLCIPDLRRGVGLTNRLRLCLLSGRYRAMIFIAADCLDGRYGVQREIARLELADLASRCGLNVFVSGFSFNRHPEAEVARRISALPDAVQFRPRDPLSLTRFRFGTGKPAILAADLAFLVELSANPSEDVAETARWIAAQHEQGRMVVGANLNRLFLSLVDRGECLIAELVVRLLRREDRLTLIFVPHDRRGKVPDEILHDRLWTALPEDLRARVLTAPYPATARDAKWLASRLDFVVSQRMHFAIAALGCGVPVMCFEYQDKVEGMLTYFDLAHLVIRPDEFRNLNRLADRILIAIREEPRRKRHIRAALPKVLELARYNFV